MAEVIRLEDRLERMPRKVSEPCEAQIILFTGVRYERWTETDDRPVTRSTGTKRKKH